MDEDINGISLQSILSNFIEGCFGSFAEDIDFQILDFFFFFASVHLYTCKK